MCAVYKVSRDPDSVYLDPLFSTMWSCVDRALFIAAHQTLGNAHSPTRGTTNLGFKKTFLQILSIK